MENTNSAQERIKRLKKECSELSENEIRDRISELSKARISEIRNTETNVKITGTSYYVSADGSDENDGLSPERAWKSIARVNDEEKISAGDGVFFRRGDLFRGSIKTKEGVTYSAYGKGEKPLLTTSVRNSAQEEMWIETDVPGVWEYYETNTEADIGAIIFDDSFTPRKIYRSKEKDGTQLDYRAKRVFNDYHDFAEDMTFFHDRLDTGKLYLCCKKGNPGSLARDIELSKRGAVIYAKNHVTIDNLCLAYTCFGVSSGHSKGLTVQNCEIKWIGGSIQVELGPNMGRFAERSWPTPFGNGIEIYGEAVDFTVDNNYIRQNYDAAATHQCGRGENELRNNNVKYTNNVCEHCVYSIEIFYGESPLGNRSNDNTLICGNILRMGGGFGHEARPDENVTALIRHGSVMKNTNNYVVRDNIFDRSRTGIITAHNDGGSAAQYFDNIYVQTRGKKFCTRLGEEYTADETLPEKLEATGTEHNPTFVFVEAEDF